jgi:hypothetical protein
LYLYSKSAKAKRNTQYQGLKMAKAKQDEPRNRSSLDKRVNRLTQLLNDRGEDGAQLVRTWLIKSKENKKHN